MPCRKPAHLGNVDRVASSLWRRAPHHMEPQGCMNLGSDVHVLGAWVIGYSGREFQFQAKPSWGGTGDVLNAFHELDESLVIRVVDRRKPTPQLPNTTV